MRNFIKEALKLVILIIIIGIGTVVVIQIDEPVQVKADRLQREGKNIVSEFTLKERDEYMAYLFKIRAQDMSTKSIFKWELP